MCVYIYIYIYIYKCSPPGAQACAGRGILFDFTIAPFAGPERRNTSNASKTCTYSNKRIKRTTNANIQQTITTTKATNINKTHKHIICIVAVILMVILITILVVIVMILAVII